MVDHPLFKIVINALQLTFLNFSSKYFSIKDILY